MASEISVADLRDSRTRIAPPLWRIGEEKSEMDVHLSRSLQFR
jgi:hypothetical protein